MIPVDTDNLTVSTDQAVGSSIKKLFDNDLLTDLRIVTNDGTVFRVHRVILAVRSAVFYSKLMTINKNKAQTKYSRIEDFDSKIVREILRFIYQNSVENLDKLASELIFAADKYQLEELKKLCVSSLVGSTTAENALKNLLISNQISGSKKLFDHCLLIIVK